MMTSRRLQQIGFYALVILLTLPILFPFYWMVTGAFKRDVDLLATPPLWLFQPTVASFTAILAEADFWRYFGNSAIVATGSTMLGLLVGLPAAFSIGRWKQKQLGLAVLTVRMAPGVSFLIPWFILFRQAHMIGSYPALVLTHCTVTVPLIIWIMIGFFEDLPQELFDAAAVDGCSEYSGFWRIALPVVKPGIAVASILACITSWNNFLYTVVIGSASTRTLPVMIYNFISLYQIEWTKIMAGATLVILPVAILTLLVQKHIVKGLTAGGVKG